MASHYTRGADRRRLAKQASEKIENAEAGEHPATEIPRTAAGEIPHLRKSVSGSEA
jgi:hypothetical protein